MATREHVTRLKAARMQADIMNSELLLVGRTDSLSARLIDNNSDPIDQPYILGAVEGHGDEYMTFVEAGEVAIKKTYSGSQKERVATADPPKLTTSITR